MSELLWVKEQMNLRKLANQFLTKVKSTGATRVLITSVNKGDGKARFMSELAAEMARVNQELVPLAAANLQIVHPAKFKDKLVVVYGPSYFESEGLHTIPERWMRAFDAVVVMVMARRTHSKDLLKLINWLKEYNYQNIWPILNEKMSPDISDAWIRFRERFGMEKHSPKRLTKGNAASVWQPLLPPAQDIADEYVVPAHETKDVVITPNKSSSGSEPPKGSNVTPIRIEPVSEKSGFAGISTVLSPQSDFDHTETLQGPTRMGGQQSGDLISQPKFVQSARATIRSSAPPLSKTISSVPPVKSVSSTNPSANDPIENAMISDTIQKYPPSAKSTIISSVPPPSFKKTISDVSSSGNQTATNSVEESVSAKDAKEGK